MSRLLTTHYTDLLGREGTIAADSARIATACHLFDQFGVTFIDLQRQDTQAALFRRWPTTYLV